MGGRRPTRRQLGEHKVRPYSFPTFSSSAPVEAHISSWREFPWTSMVTMGGEVAGLEVPHGFGGAQFFEQIDPGDFRQTARVELRAAAVSHSVYTAEWKARSFCSGARSGQSL